MFIIANINMGGNQALKWSYLRTPNIRRMRKVMTRCKKQSDWPSGPQNASKKFEAFCFLCIQYNPRA